MYGIPGPHVAALNTTHFPGADNTAAVCTVAADTKETWVLDWIHCSFDEGGATDYSSTLTVAFGTAPTTKWQVIIAVDASVYGGAGVFPFYFPRGLYNAKGEQMVVTLAAVANVEGKLNIGYH